MIHRSFERIAADHRPVTGVMSWFPVPGMFGGFEIVLRHGYLEVKSWNSMVAGSSQAHLITHEGVIRVDDGFV